MNPKPLSVNRLIVPSAIVNSIQKKTVLMPTQNHCNKSLIELYYSESAQLSNAEIHSFSSFLKKITIVGEFGQKPA